MIVPGEDPANLNEDKIRAVIRNYVVHLDAIAVKSQGAVYFIHNTRQATLDALQELVRPVGQGCTTEQIPLVDTGDSRRMLTGAFSSELENDVPLRPGRIAATSDTARGDHRSDQADIERAAPHQAVPFPGSMHAGAPAGAGRPAERSTSTTCGVRAVPADRAGGSAAGTG